MLFTPNMMLATSGHARELVILSASRNDSALSTYTFSAVSFGSPSPLRYIIVGVTIYDGSTNNNVGSMTIGGVSATEIATTFNGGRRACIWGALVPAGASGDIVINTNNGVGTYLMMSAWAAYGISSLTPYATAASTANPGYLNINAPADGMLIAVANPGSNGDISWTGADEKAQYTGPERWMSSASAWPTAAATPRTVTATYASASAPTAIAVVLS